MTDDARRIQASALAGLTARETEAVLGRKFTPEDRTEFDRAKAAMKLKAKQQEGHKIPEGMPLAQDRMPSLAERYTEQQVEEAIERCHGRWPLLVKALNCSYRQLGVWMENHKKHRILASSLREELVDQAEEAVWQLLNSDDPALKKDVAKFVLKTLGKGRGWSEAPSSAVFQQITAEDKAVQIRNIFGMPQEKGRDGDADEKPQDDAD